MPCRQACRPIRSSTSWFRKPLKPLKSKGNISADQRCCRLPELRTELEKKIHISEYVLPDLSDTYKRDSAYISKVMRRIFNKAKIKAERDMDTDTARAVALTGSHSFRHAFVTLARLHGIKDSVIAQITGHSTLKQMDNYPNDSTEERRSAKRNPTKAEHSIKTRYY